MWTILRRLHHRFSPRFVKRLAEWRAGRNRERLRRIRQYHLHPRSAMRRYFESSGHGLRSWLEFSPRLIRQAVEFDYVAWPRKIASDIQGRDVLEVGCGRGLHAIGYLIVGVNGYVGVEPKMDLDRNYAKNRRTRREEKVGTTPRRMARRFRRIRFLPGSIEDAALREDFDVVIFHNVTEHLMNIDEAFRKVSAHLRPGGLVIFNHHNFYCWNGHHRPPKYVEDIDPASPEQKKYMDWNHLQMDPEKKAAFLKSQVNRIRLDDLRALTEKYFRIETWSEHEIDSRRGAGRLSGEIRARYPQLTVRELTTQGVFCRAWRSSPS